MAKTNTLEPTPLMRPIAIYVADGKAFDLESRRRADDEHVKRHPELWIDAGASDQEFISAVRKRHRERAAGDRLREEKVREAEPALYAARLEQMEKQAKANRPAAWGFFRP